MTTTNIVECRTVIKEAMRYAYMNKVPYETVKELVTEGLNEYSVNYYHSVRGFGSFGEERRIMRGQKDKLNFLSIVSEDIPYKCVAWRKGDFREIYEVYDLVGKTEEELLRMDGVGKKTLQQITEYLDKFGLGLGWSFDEIENWASSMWLTEECAREYQRIYI